VSHAAAASLVGLVLLVSPACRRTPPSPPAAVQWTITPSTPSVDREVVVRVTLTNPSHETLQLRSATIEGFMDHPGMAPLVEPATDEGQGVYASRLRFTMAGSWTVFVRAARPDGRLIREELGRVTVRPASP
jgi:hypothetical protein